MTGLSKSYKKVAEFEAAFEAADFNTKPRGGQKTFEPMKPKVPWYLDKDSGGPEPKAKKDGVSDPEGELPF